MAALTANRNTKQLMGEKPTSKLTIYNAEICYAGGIAAVDYTDEVQAAADTAGLRVIGVFPLKVDNTADGLSSEVERGIFKFANSSTYPIPRSAIGEVAYVEDDQTVAAFSTNLVSCGIIHDVDSDGVWVDMRPEALTLARERRPAVLVSKTADYTVTAALAFEGRTIFSCATATTGTTITLPSAVGGMRVGIKRANASATYDVNVQAATGDKVQGYDAISAASKKVENTVDAISGIIWFRAVDDTLWAIDNPYPADAASWVKNDA
jgi:hypothetical protein